MSVMAQAAPASASSKQLHAWAQSREGLALWSALRIPLSIEQLCAVLDRSSADLYGLLISPQGTVILSAICPDTFARLESRYHAAADAGLCFWWESGTLVHIQESEAFLARVRSLPSLRGRALRGQASCASACETALEAPDTDVHSP